MIKALSKEMSNRFADARELFDALAEAVPQAFQPGFESDVAVYIEEVLGHRGSESKARIRLAQQTLSGANKNQRSSLRSEDDHAAHVPAPAATRTHAHEPPRATTPIAATANAPETAPSAGTAASADEISKAKASPLDPARRPRRPPARARQIARQIRRDRQTSTPSDSRHRNSARPHECDS